jgi:hypothetical protein
MPDIIFSTFDPLDQEGHAFAFDDPDPPDLIPPRFHDQDFSSDDEDYED